MKSSTTIRYAGAHGFYWAAACSIVSFAAVYLQLKGFDAAEVGILLSLATIASAVFQPILASAADRSRRWSLRSYLTVLVLLLLAALAFLLFGRLKGMILLLFFFLASVLLHLLEPLLNAVAGYYFNHGISLDFGVSRAAGSLFFAVSSLLLGYAAKLLGADSLIWICGVCVLGFLACIYILPAMKPGGALSEEAANAACSLPQFLLRYRRYTLVMVGFFFIACFHVMTETYLLNMMERIGGDSSHVGISLLLANISEFFVIFFYERFRHLTSSANWLRITAICFAGKAVLFHLAPNVPIMYLAQMLQSVTYGFYAPAIVHFAHEEISPQDSVKGQSVCVAIFTLGGSLGNFLGGQLIEKSSVHTMTLAAALFAILGAVIVVLVLCRPVRKKSVV